MAFDGTAVQSVNSPYPAHLAIDGDLNTYAYNYEEVIPTSFNKQWWAVDLGRVFFVYGVTIHTQLNSMYYWVGLYYSVNIRIFNLSGWRFTIFHQ